MSTPQLPPHSIESEEAVIAAYLIDALECGREGVAGILEPQDFFREHLGWVYAACQNVERPTPASLAAQLGTQYDWTPPLGWAVHLMGIEERHFTAVGVEAHARHVARLAFSRRLIEVGGRIAQRSLDRDGTPWVILDSAILELQGLHSLARRASALPADPFLARRGEMPS